MSDEPPAWINYAAFQQATRHLSVEQVGLLMTLAMTNLGPDGPLPLDQEGMRLAVKCNEDAWRRCWPHLGRFFEPNGMPWLVVSYETPEDTL
jgi:uncharacterized protein YdaU (DUF1376 family)